MKEVSCYRSISSHENEPRKIELGVLLQKRRSLPSSLDLFKNRLDPKCKLLYGSQLHKPAFLELLSTMLICMAADNEGRIDYCVILKNKKMSLEGPFEVGERLPNLS